MEIDEFCNRGFKVEVDSRYLVAIILAAVKASREDMSSSNGTVVQKILTYCFDHSSFYPGDVVKFITPAILTKGFLG